MQRELTEQQTRRVWQGVDPDPAKAVPAGSIVVGIDGSDGSVSALVWAVDEAGRRHCGVDAVLTWEEAFSFGPPTPISALTAPQKKRLEAKVESVLRRAESVLRRAENPLPGTPEVTVRTHIFSAVPASLLASLSTRATMLVVGSHGYGGLRRALLGSVGQRCAQSATGAVVIVRGTHWVPAADGARRRIVVGVDGSPGSREALSWAIGMAQESGDDLQVVHAWGSAAQGMVTAQLDEELAAIGRKVMDSVTPQLESSGCRFTTEVEYGPAEPALQRRSAEADLVVVGGRGRGGISALLLGSVSQYCVTHADCPVAIIRPRTSLA